MTAFLLFVAGLGAFVFAWLKKVAGQTAAFDAAQKAKQEAAAAAEDARSKAIEAEINARQVQESVSARLAKLEEEDAAVREKDSINIANDIIGRN